jgi:hypothetical protein
MICFSDAALVHLFIAATAVPEHAREAWLQETVAKLEERKKSDLSMRIIFSKFGKKKKQENKIKKNFPPRRGTGGVLIG